jgi:hypothetical protein
LDDLAKPQAGRSRRATSTFRAGPDGKYDPQAEPVGDREEHSNSDNRSVPPGQARVLLEAAGPGVITHIWLTFLGPERQAWAKEGSANHQEMLLRIYWDGRVRPAVEAPVGDFFANGFGERSEVISLPVIVEDGDSYNCFWRMPFRQSARVEIRNESDKPISLLYYNIDWIQLDQLPEDTPYLHASYRQEYPAQSGRDYLVLETQGKGHYVGTVLSVRTRSPSWFGEGDEKIYVDGEAKPSIGGTGTEDCFLSAWGLKKASTPYFGVPYFDEWGIVGSHTSAYRWHLYVQPQLLNQPREAAGAWLELPFVITNKEPLRLLLHATRSYDFGRYQASLNGLKLGDVLDFYDPETTRREFHLLDFWPDPGRYTLRLECVGKNPRSDGYFLGLESVRLRGRRPRVEAYGHDRNKDRRTQPQLYR